MADKFLTQSGLEHFLLKCKDTFSAKTHTHNYAGSSSAGGSATSAVKLDSVNIGSSTKPVYFDANGKPAAISYTIGTSVPSGAIFTDTNVTQTVNTSANSYPILASATANASSTATTTSVFATGIKITPSTSTITATTFSGNATSATKATKDGSGNIITSTYATKAELGDINAILDRINGEVV